MTTYLKILGLLVIYTLFIILLWYPKPDKEGQSCKVITLYANNSVSRFNCGDSDLVDRITVHYTDGSSSTRTFPCRESIDGPF